LTEQITIKLNKKQFRPLMDQLKAFGGQGITESDSDLAGKCLYFTYFFVYEKQDNGKSFIDDYFDNKGMNKAEGILKYLNAYYAFKKQGIKATNKKMQK
jgi:hypothetical protein